jgi:queuine tRNA-ribosyltransferase
MPKKYLKIQKKSKKSSARLGVLNLPHGEIKTPFFMSVATQGTVKHITAEEMRQLGAQILLSNTYHLMLRPGELAIKKFGGLHKFMDWDGPILTDSGGFQVFSLAKDRNKNQESLVKLNKDGVEFRSYVDGRKYYLTPEKSLQIQADLGVDIAVCLDECVALPAERKYVEESVELTRLWAEKSKKHLKKIRKNKPRLHCVIQGGLDKELRLKSLAGLRELDFDGYNIGGLSVGETASEMYEVLDYLVSEMPEDRPRYLMGVGYPDNILEAVKRGVDMFDCVIPSREGRHGRLFYWVDKSFKKKNFYKAVNIKLQKFSTDKSPINKDSKFPALRNLSKVYLNYLLKIKEPLGQRLASLHNLEFYIDLMEEIRKGIRKGEI